MTEWSRVSRRSVSTLVGCRDPTFDNDGNLRLADRTNQADDTETPIRRISPCFCGPTFSYPLTDAIPRDHASTDHGRLDQCRGCPASTSGMANIGVRMPFRPVRARVAGTPVFGSAASVGSMVDIEVLITAHILHVQKVLVRPNIAFQIDPGRGLACPDPYKVQGANQDEAVGDKCGVPRSRLIETQLRSWFCGPDDKNAL